MKVETGSGDVTLKVPPTLGAEVDIETSSGDIETDFEVAVTRHARDHMTGRIGDGRGKIAIETGSGGIKLVKAGSRRGGTAVGGKADGENSSERSEGLLGIEPSRPSFASLARMTATVTAPTALPPPTRQRLQIPRPLRHPVVEDAERLR